MPASKRKAENVPGTTSPSPPKKPSTREPSIEFHMQTRRSSRQASAGTVSAGPTPNPTPTSSRRGSAHTISSQSKSNTKKRKQESIEDTHSAIEDFDITAFVRKIHSSRGSNQTSSSEPESASKNVTNAQYSGSFDSSSTGSNAPVSQNFNDMVTQKTFKYKKRRIDDQRQRNLSSVSISISDSDLARDRSNAELREEERPIHDTRQLIDLPAQTSAILASTPSLTQTSYEDDDGQPKHVESHSKESSSLDGAFNSSEDDMSQLKNVAYNDEQSSEPSRRDLGVPAILVEGPAESMQHASVEVHHENAAVQAAQLGISSPSLSPPPSAAEDTDKGHPIVSRSVSVVGRRPPGRQAIPRTNPRIEACYIRTRQLKKSFKEVLKALKPALAELANRTEQELENDPNAHINSEGYKQVLADLDKRLLERKAIIQAKLKYARKQGQIDFEHGKNEIERLFKRRMETSRADNFRHAKLDLMRLVTKKEDDSEATDDERFLVKGKNVRYFQPFKRDWAMVDNSRNYDPHDRDANKVPYDLVRYDNPEREKSRHATFYPAIDKVWDDWVARGDMQGSLSNVLPRPHSVIDPEYEKTREELNVNMLLQAAVTAEEAELIRKEGELGKLAVAARVQREHDEADARRAKLKAMKSFHFGPKYIDALHSPPPKPPRQPRQPKQLKKPKRGAMGPPPPRRPSK